MVGNLTRKNRRSFFVGVVTIFGILWCYVLVYLHQVVDSKQQNSEQRLIVSSPVSILAQSQHHGQQQQQQQQTANQAHNTESSSSIIPDNPWYGWQPKIESQMECSWTKCFNDKNNCRTCRDKKEDLKEDDQFNATAPDNNWIPDVTMLRRMFVKGIDAKGNPWPPPLDDELCQGIGNHDGNLKAFDSVPIIGSPISKELNTGNNKLLCLIYTMETAHATNIRAIRETWASGCDGFLAFSTKSDPRIPTISLKHKGPEDYYNMWQKVRSIWKFVGDHYQSQFDWFYIGGEDMFVIPQNLKNYLGTFDSSKPYFLGRRFKGGGGGGTYFNSGGSGYVLSRPSLQCFMENFENGVCNPNAKSSMEDVYIANCLRKACDIHIYDTRDSQKRERFHPFAPATHLQWKPPVPPNKDWYYDYNKEWGILLGKDCCAPDSVSFHYIKKAAQVRHLFHYLHGCPRDVGI